MIKTFAVTNKNKDILIKSSSGGVFYILAKYVFSQLHGSVYGVIIDNKGHVFHKKASSIEDIYLFTSSKYVYSNIMNTYKEVLDDLHDDKYVLYSGLPCQIYGLKKFLMYKNANLSKLVTIDFVCHGAPHKKYWELYLKEKFSDKNVVVNFRDKTISWENYCLNINNEKYPYQNNEYMLAFLANYTLQEGCYNCNFKGEKRSSDITLGDFWGIKKYYKDFYNPLGVSLVIVRNKFDLIMPILKTHCLVNEVKYGISLIDNPSYYECAIRPLDKDIFDTEIFNIGFIKTVHLLLMDNSKKPRFNTIYNLIYKFNDFHSRTYKNKVGIVTDYGYYNFGNRLQNYALRTTIKSMGYKAINISMIRRGDNTKILFNLLTKIWNRRKYTDIHQKSIYNASIKSGEKNYFFAYNEKSYDEIESFNSIILGSDQIWNFNYQGSNLPFMLGLPFNNNNVFSYACSFGVDVISEQYAELYRDGFKSLKAIGVREKNGIDLIKKLGYESELNLDPTLLLTKDDWNLSIKKYAKIKVPSNYILFYGLLIDFDKSIIPCKFNGLHIISIFDSNSQYYSSNQFDFVNLIKNADLIITDSFHAVSFSFIYQKKIIILKNNSNTSSRLESLFALLDFELHYNCIIDFCSSKTNRIEELKNQSLTYLNLCLKHMYHKS